MRISDWSSDVCSSDLLSALWALTRFDLYAPGLEKAGLGPDRVFYAQGANDRELLAMCEDALPDGALACVVAAVKAADQDATPPLQLAAWIRRALSRGKRGQEGEVTVVGDS